MEKKNIFHSFWRAIIWWKNKNFKIVDASFSFALVCTAKVCQHSITWCYERSSINGDSYFVEVVNKNLSS